MAEDLAKQVYGRRHGRPLRAARQDALTLLLPELGIPETLITENGSIDPAGFFSDCERIHLEIGFGNGEHLAALMLRHETHGFIGAEPFVNGMSAFLKCIREFERHNVRVWMEDALRLVRSLTPCCIDTIYILNPDPWPKKRHHKRRIVRQETLDEYARVLKPGGTLVMSTDDDELAGWMCEHASRHPSFEWTAESASHWRAMPQDWIETRYERKGRESGRRQTYLLFVRK